jgi:hypothetical protein
MTADETRAVYLVSNTIYGRVGMNSKRHRFQNKAAVVLTIATLVLLVCLSALFGTNPSSNSNDAFASHRYLEENDNDDGNGDEDFSSFSCRYIYNKTPDPGADQCRFASTCNQGEGVMASWVFCSNRVSAFTLFLVISPFLIFWMIILFRLLGSTAEDFFSPALEMFAVKLGLP